MISEVVNALKMELNFFPQEVGVYRPHASSKQNTKEITDHKKIKIKNRELKLGKTRKMR